MSRICYQNKQNWVKCCCLATVILLVSLAHANEVTDRRVKISLPMFPRIVAVDSNFTTKLTKEKKARLVFVYDSDQFGANNLAAQLAESHKKIVNIAVETLPLPLNEQLKAESIRPTAIFVAERLSDTDFRELVLYGIENGIIVFSPYSGDVERGATVGLAITSRVFPYFNTQTLEKSGLKINSLLLNMSKHYE